MTPIAGGGAMAGRPLSDGERAIYAWQFGVPGFGEEGQQRLKGASVLVSRVGGVGGMVAYQLAAAGVGKLVLAHAGELRPDDLNRQLLMRHDGIGKPAGAGLAEVTRTESLRRNRDAPGERQRRERGAPRLVR